MYDFHGRKVLVIGLARSGLAAIDLLHKLGADITLSEMREEGAIKEAADLRAKGVRIVGQTDDVFEENYDLVIKNPGIPSSKPFVKTLRARGIPVITEIELAFMVAKPQHYLAVTGTNGKTTTATLLGEIIKAAYPDKTHVTGNIGIPLCRTVLDYNLLENEGHYIVLEISNFQLVDIVQFHPQAAVILNLTPDHVDVMGSLQNYYESKTRVYRRMTEDELFIRNVDDADVTDYCGMYPVPCKTLDMSLASKDAFYHLADGRMWAGDEEIMPLDEIKIVGMHNVQNCMAAAALARAAGVSNEIIRRVISAFKGVEHRIEFVRELHGVRYYNDSKGTNPDATITALKAFTQPVILLVGGFEKGLAMDEVKKYIGNVKKVIGFGACGARLVKELVGTGGIVVATMDEALQQAHSIAQTGDVVLLSPTTSSFDQFSCYEQRGEIFVKLVNALEV
ncbi:MAG: UDP-N-acetylmuramoyl-L-alanine--D-glutamate ligase [Clostridia bacterium]|nr:UDP-N-acetylmuramoyl-L-alanine--D-glutamate ligase [Clostridia bacterium]MBR2414049.1 UDP-N-acetylmuramoyl-L-alanine--D-glutamate ligase [Clostridia bacterium]